MPCSNNSCPPRNISFFINVVLHVFILLVIISSFFFFYVSNLSRQIFQDELANIINDNMTKSLQQADDKKILKNVLKIVNWDRIVSYYQTNPDRATEIQNKWLFRVTALAIGFLFVTIVLSILILKFSCKQDTPIAHIVKENLILFSIVGIVEVLFFLQIAKNFVPTKPSLMFNSILKSLKNEFSHVK